MEIISICQELLAPNGRYGVDGNCDYTSAEAAVSYF